MNETYKYYSVTIYIDEETGENIDNITLVLHIRKLILLMKDATLITKHIQKK